MRPRTGHLYKRGQSWYCRVTWTDETGKRRVIKRSAPTKNQARVLAQQLLREIEERGQIDGARMTFAQLADRYEELKLVPARFIGDKQVAGYRSLGAQQLYLKTLRQHFGRRFIRSITHADLEAFKQRRLDTPVKVGKPEKPVIRPRSIASVHRELETLRRMLNFALRNGWILKNPFNVGDPVITKSAENRRTRILSFDEEARLLAVCEGPRAHLRPIVITAVDSAMRRGELLKMRWDWIDFGARLIRIPARVTKTMRARNIAMTSRVEAELRRLWEVSPRDPEGLVLGIERDFKHAWMTALKKAEIEGLRFHDLRHSAATRLIAAGVPHVEVMRVTGHESLDMLSRYVNINEDSIRRAADALDAHVTSNLKKPEKTEFVN